jgi:hypothetical protein
MDDAYAARLMIRTARAALDLLDPADADVARVEPRLRGEPAATIANLMMRELPASKARELTRAALHTGASEKLGPVLTDRLTERLASERGEAGEGSG